MSIQMLQNVWKLFYREENILIVNHRKGDVNDLKGKRLGFDFVTCTYLKQDSKLIQRIHYNDVVLNVFSIIKKKS